MKVLYSTNLNFTSLSSTGELTALSDYVFKIVGNRDYYFDLYVVDPQPALQFMFKVGSANHVYNHDYNAIGSRDFLDISGKVISAGTINPIRLAVRFTFGGVAYDSRKDNVFSEPIYIDSGPAASIALADEPLEDANAIWTSEGLIAVYAATGGILVGFLAYLITRK